MDVVNKHEVIFDDGIIIIEMDKNGTITYVNSKFKEITGYSNDYIIGKYYNDYIDETMPKSATIDIWETIYRKRIWRGYVKSVVKGNKYYWGMLWVQPRFNNNKVVVGYVATLKEAYRNKIDKIEIYLNFLEMFKNNSNIHYPYGKELIFGSDFIASKYLDLDLNDRLDNLVDNRSHIKFMKDNIDI